MPFDFDNMTDEEIIRHGWDYYFYLFRTDCPTLGEKEFVLGVRSGRFDLNTYHEYMKPEPPLIPIIELPKCPHCNSGRVKRLGVGEHVLSIVYVGLSAESYRGKSSVCTRCGCRW